MSTFRRYDKFFDFEKVDEGEGIIYGWAIVCTIDGEPYVDLQGDHIPVAAMLDATASFMAKNERPGLDMHAGEARGDIVFGLPITKNTHKQLTMKSDREGFYIGWKPRDEAAKALVKSGERLGFSIGGWIEEADDVEIAKDAKGDEIARIIGTRYAREMDRLGNELEATQFLAKAKTKDKKQPEKYRMFRRFHLDEISIVDRPAQEGALIGFVKRAVIAQSFTKAAIATSSVAGHQHVLDLSCIDSDGFGYTWSAETGKEHGWHSHRWQRDPETGVVKILDNAGHGHDVPDGTTADLPKPPPSTILDATPGVQYVSARAPGVPLTSGSAASSVTSKSHTTEPKMTPEQIEALNKRLAKAESLASMSDAEKAYLAKLGSAQADDFIAKSITDRAAIMKSDEPVYTATDGTVFRKSDDERLWKAVKRADEMEKSFAEEKLARKRAEFSKQANEDMGNLPGDAATHAAVIEAITSGIGDEAVRKAAFEAIRAGNAAIAKAGKTSGSRGAVEKAAGSDKPNGSQDSTVQAIEKKFRDRVTEYQKENKLPTYENALSKATQMDPITRDLYDELEEARAAERN